jgi:protein gp37
MPTGIQWTDETWNPTTGCKRVSPGCDHCYAFDLHDTRHVAWRRGRFPSAPAQYHKPFSVIQMHPERLYIPLGWRRPRRVFVNSMSDLWHDDIPGTFLARAFAVMAATPHHTYQILTKRPERMRSLLCNPDFREGVEVRLMGLADRDARAASNTVDAWPLPNVWLGVSAEDQQRADERIPVLLDTPAAVRFVSAEPLLGPLDLTEYMAPGATARGLAHYIRTGHPLHGGEGANGAWAECWTCDRVFNDHARGLDWVIVGGESGKWHRQMHPDWARDLRNQCAMSGVAFFFKQRGGVTAKAGGRELDGREWNEYPDPETGRILAGSH